MNSKLFLPSSWIYILAIISTTSAVTNTTGKTPNQKVVKLLKEAGCAAGGRLLAKGVCINDDYQENEAPDQHITSIYCTIYHHEVLEIKEKEKKVEVDVKMTSFWIDDRVKANFSTPNPFPYFEIPGITIPWSKNMQYLWFPGGSEIDGVHKIKLLHDPVTVVHVSRVGWFSGLDFNSNATLVGVVREYQGSLFCGFNFTDFPMDTQLCQFRLITKIGQEQHLSLYEPWQTTSYHAVKRYELDGFDITVSYVDGNLRTRKGASYIGLNIEMHRLSHPFLFQYYLPCIAIVFVSQLSFIIPPSAIPGRIGLVATQFLTLTNLFIHQMVKLDIKLNYSNVYVFVHNIINI